jgi:PAS domain S-box-containing protein
MKLGIRVKLLIGFTLLVGLSLLIQAFAFTITNDYIISQTSRMHLEKAKEAEHEIELLFKNIEDHAKELSRVQTDHATHSDVDFTIFANHVLTLTKVVTKVSILSATGREQFRYDKDGETPGDKLNIELPSKELGVAFGGDKAVSKVYYLGNDSSPYINIFFPVKQGSVVISVIKMQVNLESLWDYTATTRLGERGFAYIVEEDGTLIAHRDSGYVAKRPNLAKRSIIQRISRGEKRDLTLDDYTYVNEKEEEVIAQAIKVRDVNWIVVFEQPTSEAFAVLNFIRNIFFFTMGGSLILLLLIALFLSDNLTRPILLLKEMANRLQNGQLNTRISVKSHDELEDLANSFNSMAVKLQSSFLKEEEDKNIISAERNKMAVALSSIADGVIVVDLDRKIVLFNKGAENITGYTADAVVGKSIDQVVTLYKNNVKVLSEIYCPVRNDKFEGIVFSDDDIKMVGHNEKESYVTIMTGKIMESTQANIGCILVLHDVSKEKQLEDMKLDFVSMAAHELRTPLTSIRGYLSVFLDESDLHLNDEQKMFLQRINIASEQLMALVENLLNITRIERGALTLSTQNVVWIDVVRKIVDELADRAKQKNITLTLVEPAEPLPNVVVDVFRISEVVTNLLANAINYTYKDGSVTVRIELKDHKVVTHIVDTGEGIPQEAIPHLFAKFFRVAGKLEQGSKGTGLGLYISKAIVEMHHGDIWVESELGKGSTFSFSIPVVENG